MVGHYKGKCYAWDVVNEALNEDGSYRSSVSVWGSTIGPAFIPMAFAAAAAADPAAKLYYNDYNCDKAGAKATGAQNLIRMVRSYGAPIHGFGMQGHFSTGQVGGSSALVSNMQAFTALGVEVAYTELDMATPSSNPNLNQQATDYATVVSACKQVSGCVGITIWGFTDKYTWISNSAPLPWNTNLQKKPAYTSILNAWGSSGTGSPTTTAGSAPSGAGGAEAEGVGVARRYTGISAEALDIRMHNLCVPVYVPGLQPLLQPVSLKFVEYLREENGTDATRCDGMTRDEMKVLHDPAYDKVLLPNGVSSRVG